MQCGTAEKHPRYATARANLREVMSKRPNGRVIFDYLQALHNLQASGSQVSSPASNSAGLAEYMKENLLVAIVLGLLTQQWCSNWAVSLVIALLGRVQQVRISGVNLLYEHCLLFFK